MNSMATDQETCRNKTMSKKALSLNDEELARLIEGEESARVEFKETLGGNAPDRIREAICAFANDLPGSGGPGIAVVGLRDDGTPAGITITDETLRTLTDMRSDGNILPPPTILVEKRLYQGRDVAVVTVLPADSPPVRFRGAIRVRNGPRRSIATAQEERILNERRRHGNRPFDVSPVPGTSIGELNRRQFEDEYLPNAVSRELLSANDRSLGERLAAAKMIASVDDERATILGLLVLGICPRDFIPGAYVQFLRIKGQELSDPIVDEMLIDGTISEMLSRVDDKLRSHNLRQVDIVNQDTERRVDSYPLAALQELVRNAVVHRDYETTNAPVRVTWFDDRIEIQNPGGPFGSVTTDNFAHPGVTDYRNPNLAESMRVLGFVQRFGVGIPTAIRLLREGGHPELDFIVQPTHVLVTVRAVPEA